MSLYKWLCVYACFLPPRLAFPALLPKPGADVFVGRAAEPLCSALFISKLGAFIRFPHNL